jgi:hypothetical protein
MSILKHKGGIKIYIFLFCQAKIKQNSESAFTRAFILSTEIPLALGKLRTASSSEGQTRVGEGLE